MGSRLGPRSVTGTSLRHQGRPQPCRCVVVATVTTKEASPRPLLVRTFPQPALPVSKQAGSWLCRMLVGRCAKPLRGSAVSDPSPRRCAALPAGTLRAVSRVPLLRQRCVESTSSSPRRNMRPPAWQSVALSDPGPTRRSDRNLGPRNRGLQLQLQLVDVRERASGVRRRRGGKLDPSAHGFAQSQSRACSRHA